MFDLANNSDSVDPDYNHFQHNPIDFRSFSVDTFKEFSSNISESFSLFHHNARSICTPGRMEEYDLLFDMVNNPFDILVFTETWLTKDKIDLCKFEGFQSIHHIRPIDNNFNLKERGGGISIFIKDGIEFKIRQDLTKMLPFMESCFIELSINQKKFLIGGLYRAPDTHTNLFTEKLNEMLEPLKNNHQIILLGDFNVDLLKNIPCTNNFQLCLQSNYLVPTITEPTRISTSRHANGELTVTKSLIDNIFINANINNISGIIKNNITDHFPIFINLTEIINKQSDTHHYTKYREIEISNMRRFDYALKQKGICNSNDNTQAAESFSKFKDDFDTLYDQHFPIKTKITKQKDIKKPWVNEDLKKCIKIRDKLGKLVTKKLISPDVFKRFRNQLVHKLRKAKEIYFTNKFNSCQYNAKLTWNTINSVIRSKSKELTVNLVDEQNNSIAKDKVPNKFVEYFTSIAAKLSSELPVSELNASSYLTNRIQNSFLYTPTDSNEIMKVITDLKSNGKGIFKISTKVLEFSKTTIAPYLANTLNKCVIQGYFPYELKAGCITPIFKSGDRKDVKNYRPVCSLSPFSKIFERIIYNRMYSFLEKNDILSSSQHGFRKKHSTESALINYINNINKGLNNSEYVASIFMDLSKAFDVIDHTILKQKLEHYGFRGAFLDFIISYVQNRQYFVSTNGYKSPIKTVNIGVPQGSILGPLLFLLYVNDMKNSSDVLHFLQYADDSTTTYSSDNLNNCLAVMKSECNKVLDWLLANKLIINLNKTFLMVFTNRKRQAEISININNQTIKEINECKFLGVMLDNKLNWKSHVTHISNKISKSVAILRYLKFIFPKYILKTLYLTLVYPYLIYCNIIWCTADKTIVKPLILLQKKSLRIICKADFFDHTDPLFKETKLLKIEQIFKLNCAQFIYKCYNTNLFNDFRSELITHREIHNYNTRGSSQLRLPFTSLKKCQQSFFHVGINLWNEIPITIKQANSIVFFKRQLIRHLS